MRPYIDTFTIINENIKYETVYTLHVQSTV